MTRAQHLLWRMKMGPIYAHDERSFEDLRELVQKGMCSERLRILPDGRAFPEFFIPEEEAKGYPERKCP